MQNPRFYNCYYDSGDGTRYVEGEYEVVRRTNKTLRLKRTRDGFFANYPGRDVVLPIGIGKRTRFCPSIKEYEDGEIVVYHEARGIPFIYVPAKA